MSRAAGEFKGVARRRFGRVEFAEDDADRGELGQLPRGVFGLRASVIDAGFEKFRGSADVAVRKCEECVPIGPEDRVVFTDVVS